MNPEQPETRPYKNPLLKLIFITLISITPFADKAVHIDDPLFIWTAKHIQNDPCNPYGFDVNWYGETEPMYKVTKNPPLSSYYMAAFTPLLGWGEEALHLLFLLPVIVLIAGTHNLAEHFCAKPFDAALITLFTPVFLLSGTTLMCDILMLCLWIWGMLFWIGGIKKNKKSLLCAAAILIAFSALTKYFGMCLIPLLMIWTVAERRRPDNSLFFLLIPVAILVLYQFITSDLYGRGLLLDAAAYTSGFSMDAGSLPVKLLVGTAFAGGCFGNLIFFQKRMLTGKSLILNALFASSFLILFLVLAATGTVSVADAEGIRWGFVIQFCIGGMIGTNLLALSITDYSEKRDSNSILLLFWIAGTLLFTFFFNWSVNGRTLLPLAPALGIIIVRRMERSSKKYLSAPVWKKYLPFASAAALSLLVTRADYIHAGNVRRDAALIAARYRSPGSTTWFQGHWGFQYYMESFGCKALDVGNPRIARADFIVTPHNNTNIFQLPEAATILDSLKSYPMSWIACMNKETGAGFYSDVWGPLPFTFGRVTPERYDIHIARSGITD